MADNKKNVVVIGAGAGLGNAVARRFGREGYRALLVARNAESLKSYERELEGEGMEARGFAADVTDIEQLDRTIDDIKSEFGEPDVVVYNVGITAPDDAPYAETGPTAESLNHHFATDVTGAYETIRKFATDEFGAKGGSIILTGGIAGATPFQGFLSLALDKAAIHNLAVYENEKLKDRGIFVGTVMVCGTIGGDEHFAPANIAERFWDMAQNRSDVEVKFE